MMALKVSAGEVSVTWSVSGCVNKLQQRLSSDIKMYAN